MGFNKIKIYLEMIKFQHSIFALPFAYFGAFVSEMKVPNFKILFWITIAMIGARSFAMALNRLIDVEIDRQNPRTAERALPKGLLSVKNVIIFSLISLSFFIISVYNLAPICRYLWPLVIIPFIVYPYTKRFTWLSHFILGICLGLAPIGAWVAVTNSLSFNAILIGIAVMFWVSGFDIFYAMQDIDFDKMQRLFSIPARFGIKKSLKLIKILHSTSITILIWIGFRLGLGKFYYMGVVIAAALLFYENTIIKADDLSRLNLAFFTINGFISIILFLFVALEVAFRSVNLG